jgi:hypothetical protein
MSKECQVIPFNNKTLFLRNIEQYLMLTGILDPSKLKKFRQESCRHILDMLNLYNADDDDISNKYLMRTYTDHCYKLRYYNSLSVINNR